MLGQYYISTGNFLYDACRKNYTAGITAVISKNKKLKFTDEPRPLFKVDYTSIDLLALQNYKVEAFKVAGVGSYRLSEELKELGEQTWLNQSKDRDKFRELARDKILKYVPINELPPGAWLETNLNTGIGKSYHAANWIRLQDPGVKGLYPAYQFLTRKDSKVRPKHAEHDNQIYLADDPIWQWLWPPLDWNCRCTTIPKTQSELQGKDIVITTPEIRKQLLEATAPGKEFQTNPGMVRNIWDDWLRSQLKDIDIDEVHKRLVEFANTNRIESTLRISKADLKTVNDSMGKDELRPVKDYNKDMLLVNLENRHYKKFQKGIKDPNEVWGKTFNKDGSTHSTQYYITFTKEGVLVATVKDAVVTEVKLETFQKAEEYRRGNLVYKKFN